MKIIILGSTGSIGENTLEVVRKSAGRLEVTGLAAHTNERRLEEQAREFKVKRTILTSMPDGEKKLQEMIQSDDTDTVVIAIVGFAALRPTLWALESGKRVALANKEALVTCGELLTQAAARHGGLLIPVDSEHNALFQALQGHSMKNIERLLITGSGGPFRGKTKKDLATISVASALQHPNWKMGPKITIDSATLMNKGLEFIEARWLFNISPKKIEVVIHPQSLIHGIVEFIDGTMLAHMSNADMKAAISYALYYPDRQKEAVKPLDLCKISRLDFEPVDEETFPCLSLAQRALDDGGLAPTVLNAANEVAVNAFLKEEIPFLMIPELISKTMSQAPQRQEALWPHIFEIDAWARQKTTENIRNS